MCTDVPKRVGDFAEAENMENMGNTATYNG